MNKALQRGQTRKRVERYRERKGVTLNPVLHFENGSYIHVNKLVDPKSRKLLTYLTENLKYQDNIRIGVFGPTVKECKKLLEVTA